MTEKKVKWTQQQARAIKERGKDILVTASAGTGKTAVLSGRCVDIVSDKKICPDVRNILVLTFTEAAAEEMRSRIAAQLKDASQQKKADSHLRHQLLFLAASDIGTIHSFCRKLITEYFYELGLDPGFVMIDADEQQLLKAEALEKTIEWAWQQSNLQQPLERLLYRRDLRTNGGWLSNIICLSNFLDGLVSRGNWYQRANLLAGMDAFSGEVGKKQKELIVKKLDDIAGQLRDAVKLCEKYDPSNKWLDQCENNFLSPIEESAKLLKSGNWKRFTEALTNFEKQNVRTPKDIPESAAKLIKDTVKNAVDAFVGLSKLSIVNPEYLNRIGGAVTEHTRVIIELVKKFDWFYRQAKMAVNCLDFADLEHYALKLLTIQAEDGEKFLPSQTAEALRKRYKYISVDEYQDINPVQQAILDALRSGDNIFVVGDIKQSIYAFRGAEPGIFLERLKPTSTKPGTTTQGLRIDLNANFRSDKGILDFVNKVFSRIMTESLSKIDYDESARLRPASAAVKTSDIPAVELHILDEKGRDKESQEQEENGEPNSEEDVSETGISARQRQAAMIAQRIRQIVGVESGKAEFEIYDKQQDKLRPVQYGDIVILLRSPATRVNDYVEVLRLAGVPVSSQDAGGYFEATEIRDCISLLKILDNPQRDIEFAAVLRSPFFKVTDSELAKIKLSDKDDTQRKNFYELAAEYSNNGDDTELAAKLKEVFAKIDCWRVSARRGSLADLIWRIYLETDFTAFVSALPSGPARKANLLKLHDRAVQFEGFASNTGVPSVRRFVEFIEKLEDAGENWTSAEPQGAAENAVRIMSVHKSKGLEFPVVFLAELNSRFNMRDIHCDLLYDAQDTLGLQIIEQQSQSRLSSNGTSDYRGKKDGGIAGGRNANTLCRNDKGKRKAHSCRI